MYLYVAQDVGARRLTQPKTGQGGTVLSERPHKGFPKGHTYIRDDGVCSRKCLPLGYHMGAVGQ